MSSDDVVVATFIDDLKEKFKGTSYSLSTISASETHALICIEAELRECREHRDTFLNMSPDHVEIQDGKSLEFWEKRIAEVKALEPKVRRFFRGLRDSVVAEQNAAKAQAKPKKKVEEGRGGMGDRGATTGRGMGGKLFGKGRG